MAHERDHDHPPAPAPAPEPKGSEPQPDHQRCDRPTDVPREPADPHAHPGRAGFAPLRARVA